MTSMLLVGKQLFVRDRFPQGEFGGGNFHEYVRRTTEKTNFDILKFILSCEALGNKVKEMSSSLLRFKTISFVLLPS